MAISGKVVSLGIVGITAAFAVGVYYAQVYGFYTNANVQEIELTSFVSGEPERILADNIQAIDAESSPIRFRACFDTPLSTAMLTETFVSLDRAEPRNAPDWFSCFDAAQIGEDLATGAATAFMGHENFEYGIDRIVAIYPDGRGYVWHQINDCGDKLYDGTPVGTDCPER